MGGRTLWVCLQTFSRKLEEVGHTLNVDVPPPMFGGSSPKQKRKRKHECPHPSHLPTSCLGRCSASSHFKLQSPAAAMPSLPWWTEPSRTVSQADPFLSYTVYQAFSHSNERISIVLSVLGSWRDSHPPLRIAAPRCRWMLSCKDRLLLPSSCWGPVLSEKGFANGVF